MLAEVAAVGAIPFVALLDQDVSGQSPYDEDGWSLGVDMLTVTRTVVAPFGKSGVRSVTGGGLLRGSRFGCATITAFGRWEAVCRAYLETLNRLVGRSGG